MNDTSSCDVSRRSLLVAGAALAAAPSAAWSAFQTSVFPDELILEADNVPVMVRFKPGQITKPVLLFFTGGGHLARIAYGHPGSAPDDFLLPHLERREFGTIALSYPTNHPQFRAQFPDLSIRQWTRAAVAVSRQLLGHNQPPHHVVGIGWSLGGRVARDLAVEAGKAGLTLDGFIGLSATAPLPGFGSLAPDQFALAASGLWDSSSPGSFVVKSRESQLAVIDALNGRVIIPRDIYARDYLCDTPLNLRGEAEQMGGGRIRTDIAAAITEQGSFDFASYPLTGAIASGGQSDARHALTDASAWAFLNAQTLYMNDIAPRLAHAPLLPDSWMALQVTMDGLAARLGRRVDGSHFFFVGAKGATQTARHIEALIAEIASIRKEIAGIFPSAG